MRRRGAPGKRGIAHAMTQRISVSLSVCLSLSLSLPLSLTLWHLANSFSYSRRPPTACCSVDAISSLSEYPELGQPLKITKGEEALRARCSRLEHEASTELGRSLFCSAVATCRNTQVVELSFRLFGLQLSLLNSPAECSSKGISQQPLWDGIRFWLQYVTPGERSWQGG